MESRSREYLTPDEVKALLKAAKASGRYGQRDACLILLAYRHGLRVAEVVSMRWDAVDLTQGLLAVTRVKAGTPSTHPLRGPELRELRELRRQWPDSSYLFVSERGGPMTTSNVRKMVARCGQQAKLGFPAHPHQLRHALGFYLANKGEDTRAIQQYMGHKNIRHTARYTELAPDRFKSFFKD
jgi:integrase